MVRATFGGGAADFIATVGPGRVVRAGAGTITLWSAAEGGVQYTDLLLDGAPVTSIMTDASGQLPAFQGPDGVAVMWAEAGGSRVRLDPEGFPGGPASDEAVSTYLANPASDSRTTLNGLIAESVTPFARRDRLSLNILDYGGKGDRAVYSGVSITAGSQTVAISGLTPADVGKLMVIPGAAGNNVGTGQPDNLVATITGRTSTTATISTPAATTVSGGTAHVGTNNTAAIAAMQAASPASGATFFFPRGDYMYSSQITPKDYTTWLGEGRHATTFLPCSTTHGFYRMGNTAAPYGPTATPDAPVRGVQWRDLAVDGALATGQMKGWYLNHMQECVWERTTCKNTGASGYGVDYLQDCWFLHTIVENAGARGSISSAGFSGYGIGSGAWERENVYFIGAVARGNKRFGLFIENQDTATQSFGAQVIGGIFEGNQWGISDNGTDSLIVNGAHICDNNAEGFVLTTTAAIEQVGIRGQLVNCTITGNGQDGVQFDWTQSDTVTWGNYRVAGNLIEGNGGYGVRTRCASGKEITDMWITDNIVRDNGAAGVGIFGSLGASTIARNEINNNGTGGTFVRGVMVAGDLRDVNIDGNRIGDTRSSGKTQQHGLWFSASAPTVAVTGGRITGNDLRGNGTAAIANFGQVGATSRVRDNDGFNPLGSNDVSVTASPFTYTAGNTRETVYINGGTFTSITLNGVQIVGSGANANIAIPLSPQDSLVLTYSSSPTAMKRWRH